MSLASDLAFYKTSPVPLLEFDKLEEPVFAVNIASFTWFFSKGAIYQWIDSAFDGVSRVNPYAALVSSVRTNEGFYVNALSADNCIATDGTFFWGVGTVDGYSVTGLWVHRYDGNNPLNYTFLYGITYGFRKGGTKQYYNDVEYEDRLISIPSIKRSKSSYYTGKSVNEGGGAALGNAEEDPRKNLDSLIKDKSILGNAARCKLGLAHYNYESFQYTFSGYLRKTTAADIRQLKLDLKQKDDKLDIPLPPNRYTLSAFPYMNPSNNGKEIPLVYGAVFDNPHIVCLNETETTPTYYTFMVCDTEKHPINAISAAYVYLDNVKTALTIVSTDLAAGTFTVAAGGDYEPGKTVTVDMEGFVDSGAAFIETALDQIKDMIVTFGRAQDSTLYFNTTYWDDASTLNFKTGFVIDKDTNIQKVIEEVTKTGTLAHFQTDDDGRYSCRIFDETAAVALDLQDCDIMSVMEIQDSADDELTAELVVNYNHQIKSDTYEKIINDDYKEDCDKKYETYTRETKNTIITDATDAGLFGEAFQARYGTPSTIVQVKTGLMCFERRICDVVKVPLHRPKSIERGDWKAELIGLEINFDEMVSYLTLRLFEEVTE